MRRVDSLEKTLMLGGIGGRRRRGQQRMRWLDGITDSMDPCSPRDSQESSPTPQCKSINSSALSFLHSPTLMLIFCKLEASLDERAKHLHLMRFYCVYYSCFLWGSQEILSILFPLPDLSSAEPPRRVCDPISSTFRAPIYPLVISKTVVKGGVRESQVETTSRL